jgi:hypothetical protein
MHSIETYLDKIVLDAAGAYPDFLHVAIICPTTVYGE